MHTQDNEVQFATTISARADPAEGEKKKKDTSSASGATESLRDMSSKGGIVRVGGPSLSTSVHSTQTKFMHRFLRN